MTPIIEVRNIGKDFGADGTVRTVFDDLSCSIVPRSFVSIIGPSGCGKSTLLKLICGLEPPTRGAVMFRGARVAGPAKGMIYVFQQYAKSIFPWRTVIGNVAFGLAGQGRLGRREVHDKCREYIRLVGLEGHENDYPYQLSGGMQQRVCIARALIREPAVLLMDEPFSALDAMTRAVLQELILRIWDRIPVTILFVTHDVEEAVFLSSRILSLGKTPSRIKDDVAIDLPYPRDQIATREQERFIALRHRLFESIFVHERGGHELAAAPEIGLSA